MDLAVISGERQRERYRHFIEEAGRRGIPLCSLETVFDGRALPSLTVNVLDAHPNELADGLAAAALADCLRESGSMRASTPTAAPQ